MNKFEMKRSNDRKEDIEVYNIVLVYRRGEKNSIPEQTYTNVDCVFKFIKEKYLQI